MKLRFDIRPRPDPLSQIGKSNVRANMKAKTLTDYTRVSTLQFIAKTGLKYSRCDVKCIDSPFV